MSRQVRVVKINEKGMVTFSMPEMAGQYLLVEEHEGQIILSPYDLRWQPEGSSIAKFGKRLHFVPSQNEVPPAA